MDVRLEQAAAVDIPELIELRLAYLTDDFGALSDAERESLPQEIRPYLEWHMGRDLRVFVARTSEGAIACCAWLLMVDKPPSPRFPRGKTGVLFNVYTRRACRRRGLARCVMRTLLDDARSLGLDVVELHATDDGYPLYQSLGFADDSNTHKPMRMML
jgi:GNAT superfamily N-acetyltransferase